MTLTKRSVASEEGKGDVPRRAASAATQKGLTASEALRGALEQPSGARFYRCAFQINPFSYLQTNKKSTPFTDEDSYNQAIVDACLELGVEVIAVTDHYRVNTGEGLVAAARNAGIHVFRGFEAVTKDGVHLLCLFDEDKTTSSLERIIGECGVHDTKIASPTGQLDCDELLRNAHRWGAVCIAAHVAADGGGLLKKLSGQTRAQVWKSPALLAASLPGPIADAPDGLRQILQNKEAQYHRDHPVAIVNAQDVSGPDDLKNPSASCWVKMSSVSVEGLRQAFLDPESRIRLATDPLPEEHAEFLALAWEGGFLDGTTIHFNENLNVLVGGRGTGKSTIIESLRCVLALEPLGEEAEKLHDGVVRHVLRSGTKISLLIRSHRPTPHCYTIERMIPNPPIVRDEDGTVLNLTPTNILPRAEIFGQHEISELTRSREKLTVLLERFTDHDVSLTRRKAEVQRELERSRVRLMEADREVKAAEARLAALPALEETLKRFQQAGLEERLKEQSMLVREERIVETVTDRIAPFKELQGQLQRSLPIDTAFVSPKALEGLPNAKLLAEAGDIFGRLNQRLTNAAVSIAQALGDAEGEFEKLRERWTKAKAQTEAAFGKILRELQKSKIDGAEFIRLRRQIEELRPLKEQHAKHVRDLREHETHRRKLIAEWEDLKAKEFRAIERAAQKVSRVLRDRVQVQVTFAGNREPLFRLIRDEVGGNLSAAVERLKGLDHLSLPEFAAACREGKDALVKQFGLSPATSERIVGSGPELFMRIEELDLTPTTKIELNTAAEGEPAVWQSLEELSTGQKATAVLLLLLLESEAPLVVDQPEDDLDNRFITDGVVPIMRREKRKRQFLFSTHNANIPVLGDAELILGLTAKGEAGQGQARIPPEFMGSIDAKPVRELVEEILEGGKVAFETRRMKYGF